MQVRFLSWILLLGSLVASGAQAQMPDFTELVAKNAPAVVNISTTTKPKNRAYNGLSPEQIEQLGPFAELFRPYVEPEQSRENHSLGSGFIIEQNGYIITNNHVVEDADEVVVRFNDRRELPAKVVGKDQNSDIALLKVEAKNLPTVKIGSADDLKVGQWVLAIGSPFGFDATVTAGIVSAIGRALPSGNYVPFIQTDVAINPGNSGGPLFNLDGEVVGVNSQIFSRTGGFMGLSFAIPIDDALAVAKQIKTHGKVARGWLGVTIQEVSANLAKSFGLPKPQGALIADVLDGSPAARAKLQAGDVIVGFNGSKVVRSSALPPMVGRVKPNDTAVLDIYRNGKQKSVKVKIGELGNQLAANDDQDAKARIDNADKLGMALAPLNDHLRAQLQVPTGGVLVGNIGSGAAADAGIRRGDVITHVDGKKVENQSQFADLIAKYPAGKIVPILVARPHGREFLALRIP